MRLSPIGKCVSDPRLAISITIGPYLLAVTLPKIAPHLGNTDGLMGFFNGKKDKNLVFRKANNNMNNWAKLHVVSAANPPITIPKSNVMRKLNSWAEPQILSEEFHIYPGHMPKITPKKLKFCRKLLKNIVKNKKKYLIQLHSCLQDADSPSVARSIAKVFIVAKQQQRKAKVALVLRVIKQYKINKLKNLTKNIKDDDDDDDE
jgi:hypothetical protein